MLEIRLLGGFDVRLDGRTISIPSRPAQSLFAYLVLNPGSPHRRERLAGLFWPDSTDESARNYLRHALWRIRKSFPSNGGVDCLISNDLTIAFDTSQHYWVDSAEVQQAGENAPLEELLPALALYRGELLPGFYDEWVVLEREHLQAVFEHQMARLMALLQGEGRWQEIIEWGERWVSFGQKPEPAFRALMRAHAALGEMSKVAATYERCTKSLQEYGLEPSEQTLALFHDLKAGRDLPKAGSMPSRVSAAETPSNIPVPLTSFIGREEDLKEIASLVGTSRLVTLTGPGGVGKTRLAIQTAHNSIKEFKDGVFWVGLVGISDPNLIPQEIAQVLDIQESPGRLPAEMLKTQLKSREILIVLDNCEHLIRACAQYAEELLAACPKMKILTTSLEALGIYNETVWQVPSLSLPDVHQELSLKELEEYTGVALFIERAGNARPGFLLTERNAKYVVRICQRLDGMPLAIELAAARIKVLTVEDIASRLDDRFSLLTAGSRTAVPRHQTLRATIDWSHNLLSEPERILFRRLSVFVGGFTLEAAESVCGQRELKRSGILDLLGRLVDKSLVSVEQMATTSDMRYHFLETIRQYAIERLDEAGEIGLIRDQHLLYFTGFATKTQHELFGVGQDLWMSRIEAEVENLRAALDWSVLEQKAVGGGDPTWRVRSGLELAGALTWFLAWFMQNSFGHEILERLKHSLSLGDAKTPTAERARALNTVGFINWTMNRFEEAREYLDEALVIDRASKDILTEAWTTAYLGTVLISLEQKEQARDLLEHGLELARQAGKRGAPIIAIILVYLGDLAYLAQEDSRSNALYDEGVQYLGKTHNPHMLAYTIRRWGYLRLRQGDAKEAARMFRESMLLNHQVRHWTGFAAALAGLGSAALATDRPARAAALFGAVERRLTEMNSPLFAIDQREYEKNVEMLRSKLSRRALEAAWSKGASMTIKDLMQFGQEESRAAAVG